MKVFKSTYSHPEPIPAYLFAQASLPKIQGIARDWVIALGKMK
jgi:hypothetical protein